MSEIAVPVEVVGRLMVDVCAVWSARKGLIRCAGAAAQQIEKKSSM